MLLDYDADPRFDPIPLLKQAQACPKPPVETARVRAEVSEPGPMKEFYREAYQILKKATDRLNSK